MPQFVVQHRYASGLGGPWQPGELVELSEAEANALNDDSPGVLRAVTRAEKGPKRNRMVQEPEQTRSEEPPAQEPITPADFKAVKERGDVRDAG